MAVANGAQPQGQAPPQGQFQGTPPGYPPQYGYPPQPKNHPAATVALVLGIIALAAPFVLGLIGWIGGPICGIIAVIQAKKALAELPDPSGMYTGEGMAKAGMIMGIIGAILGGLLCLLFIGLMVFMVLLMFLPFLFL